MARKSANTPKPAKPAGKAAKDAAATSGQKVTRASTNTRKEVRQQNAQRQGHTK